MRIIELDATNWKVVLDFYDALLAAIGAPTEHGKNVNALIDSMIWGGMNAIEPPYTIRIRHAARFSRDIISEVELVKHDLAKARAEFRAKRGSDIDVQIETIV